MNKLTPDALFLVAIELDDISLLSFCSTNKYFNNNICKKDRIWNYKLNQIEDKISIEKLKEETGLKLKKLYQLVASLIYVKKLLNINLNLFEIYNTKNLSDNIDYSKFKEISEQSWKNVPLFILFKINPYVFSEICKNVETCSSKKFMKKYLNIWKGEIDINYGYGVDLIQDFIKNTKPDVHEIFFNFLIKKPDELIKVCKNTESPFCENKEFIKNFFDLNIDHFSYPITTIISMLPTSFLEEFLLRYIELEKKIPYTFVNISYIFKKFMPSLLKWNPKLAMKFLQNNIDEIIETDKKEHITALNEIFGYAVTYDRNEIMDYIYNYIKNMKDLPEDYDELFSYVNDE